MTENEYRIVKVGFMGSVVVFMALLAAHIAPVLDDLHREIPAVAKNANNALASLKTAADAIPAIQTDTTRTEAEMAGLLNQTRRSMMTPAQTKELVDRAANLMDNANLSVIRLGAAAQSLEGIAPTTQGAIQQIAQDIHQTAEQSTAMVKAATDDLNRPEIVSSIIDAREATEAAAMTAANLEGATADLKKIADQWAAPVKGFWNHLKIFAFEVAGPAASVATAIK